MRSCGGALTNPDLTLKNEVMTRGSESGSMSGSTDGEGERKVSKVVGEGR